MIPESGQQASPAPVSDQDEKPPATERALRVLRVAVPVPLRRVFDYLPVPGQPLPVPGQRVIVPFGRRRLLGIVLAVAGCTDLAPARLRPALAYPSPGPTLDADLLQFLQWTADYYHHALGETIHTALPPPLRQAGPPPRSSRAWHATEAGKAAGIEALGRAPRQLEALQAILSLGTIAHRELLERGLNARHLSELEKKGYIQLGDARPPPAVHPQPRQPVAGDMPTLNREQAMACNTIACAEDGFHCWLLEGVTGSGKTEIYLQRISACLADGRQALLLVPEISLTPQTVSRLARRVGGQQVLVLHSGISDQARGAVWSAMADGRPMVLIGTRSAIFSPMPRAGLIIVDEEHDPSFKQQDGLRYSARDLAVWRANQLGIPVILGSATPSLESIHNAEAGRYGHLRLRRRAGAARAPALKIDDIRGQQLLAGMAPALRQRLQATIAAGAQALLFLNRRGFAPVLYCSDCASTASCPGCDVHLTIHLRARQLRCHHCGLSRRLPDRCPSCKSAEIVALGAGTQRIEQELATLCPGVPIIRVDRDSMRSEADHQALQERIARPGPMILVGTQLLAKGHDFPRITLVGVLDIDAGLLSADFRAPERTGQLLSQVAGRAGRGQAAGEVIIQTRNPDAPLLQKLARGSYADFARELLQERRAAGLPPFVHLAKLNAEAPAAESALQFLGEIAGRINNAASAGECELWGPVLSPMQRRAGRYRAQLVICSARRPALHRLLDRLIAELEQHRPTAGQRWSLDVDPMDLY